jgi:homotetrameric cytidine deaminase
MWNKDVLKALDFALKCRARAHAPYSQFLVGASFKLKGRDEYVSGCNVENASFGGTVCAERVAIWNWVSQGRPAGELEFVVIVTDTPTENVAGPCGMCLQVMSEFVGADFPIYLANLSGIQKQMKLRDIFPLVFKL